ncbi:MAG: type II toxin-antitoxin system RelE/ParE family toxin [Chitinispirillia bacterium]|nr:type II toxin-antitoxin system RelE/ParE family toxin [Chitinispirillia bacterium]MCL2241737.1 type II toxin-antitoxin system RelE/ParE family toxin [Chitinispirillia bacterium]
MDRETCIIYIGSKFTAEWYYDRRGKSVAYEFFLETPENQQAKFMKLVKEIADMGIIHGKARFRCEKDKIFAFKPQPDRYLSFFVDDRKVIVTNGFVKKTPKMPKEEKIRALKLMQDYFNRVKEGTYYGN